MPRRSASRWSAVMMGMGDKATMSPIGICRSASSVMWLGIVIATLTPT
jgi:hypothetical protein